MAEPWQEIEAIRVLKARYFRMVDTKQWAAWRALFTDDFEAVIDHAVSLRGADGQSDPPYDADGFLKLASDAFATADSVHHGHMPEIELLSPTEARGIWAMEDIIAHPDGSVFRGYGHYHERYRKDDEGWRIARLHLTRIRLETSKPA
ncbi:MAG: nuclear transport factor 2 family protein [Sphingomonadaceae bacterium]|nr:nuclear transport factor 2 family protein [Sphingomonadaceae bacterium]